MYQKAPMPSIITATMTATMKHSRPKRRNDATTGTSIQISNGKRSVM